MTCVPGRGTVRGPSRMALMPECGSGVARMADTGPAELQPLPHLETFAAAAECGSFTRAARALRLTQAAVSLRIQTLEKAVGTSLFDRRGGRVMLTDAGQE